MRTRFGAAAVSLALFTTACGSNEPTTTGTAAPPASEAAAEVAEAPAPTTEAPPVNATAEVAPAPADETGESTTTTAAPLVETRDEILKLALPVYGGGEFDPDSVAGKNVLLWFWGAH